MRPDWQSNHDLLVHNTSHLQSSLKSRSFSLNLLRLSCWPGFQCLTICLQMAFTMFPQGESVSWSTRRGPFSHLPYSMLFVWVSYFPILNYKILEQRGHFLVFFVYPSTKSTEEHVVARMLFCIAFTLFVRLIPFSNFFPVLVLVASQLREVEL